MSGHYEKQMKWKESAAKKTEQVKAEVESAAANDLKFKPTIYTVPIKPFDGHARELTEKSGSRHIERQARARREKEEQQNKLKWRSRPNPTAQNDLPPRPPSSVGDNESEKGMASPTRNINNDKSMERERRPSIASSAGTNNNNFTEMDVADIDEPIVELLERERREWHEERMKLLHCIHLQQMELNQRSIAAHDRAAEIAKEFARAIEGFEERLVSVETTVQKEIMAIKTIAESLKSSVAAIHTNQSNR